MILDFDTEKLQSLADDFYHATGVGIFVIGSDFDDVKAKSTRHNPYCNMIRECEHGRERCRASDNELFRRCRESKRAEMHVCHGGLVNIAAPIMYDEQVVGYVFLFSLRGDGFEGAREGLADLGADLSVAEELYHKVSLYEKKRFESIINLAVILAGHAVTARMIRPSADETLERVKLYIKDNLSGELSVKNISAGANVSKSVLYRIFEKNLGCTVSEYVNSKRIDKARQLLVTTGLSVAEISEQVGFASTVHFRNTFKKLCGSAPLAYRKENTKPCKEENL